MFNIDDMILKSIFFLCFLSPIVFGEILPSTDTLAVLKLLSNNLDALDGPATISHANTTPTTNLQPTLEQIQYYNNYAAAMYCQYQLNDLSCDPCKKFKDDVLKHTGT